MKHGITLILIGMVIVLAAVLTGVMIYLKNQPLQDRGIQPQINEIKPQEPNSALWGRIFQTSGPPFLKPKIIISEPHMAVLITFHTSSKTLGRSSCLRATHLARITTKTAAI